MQPEWTVADQIMWWCNVPLVICFLLMPLAVEQLFHRKKIGYFLDGWFDAISLVWICTSVFFLLDNLSVFVSWAKPIQAGVHILLTVTAVGATVYLFKRKRMLLDHPDPLLTRQIELLHEIREELRTLKDDPDGERSDSDTDRSFGNSYRDAG